MKSRPSLPTITPGAPFQAAAMLVALLALAGCQSGIRDLKDGDLAAGRGAALDGDSARIAQGGKLYGWMNCAGCHGRAGAGGFGPPLADAEWRYGGSMAQIAATILAGRPNGMPAFRGRITEEQARQLAAFVRSLSAQRRPDPLPGRSDGDAGDSK